MSDGVVNVVPGGLTRVDHESVGELHRLGSGSSQLSGDDDLATLGARLHDESEDTVAGSSHGETTEELVSEGLGLGDGGQASELDLLGVELERVLGELESLLDEGLELSDSSSLVTEDLLGVGRSDDDLRSGVGNSDLAARVSLLGELSGAGVSEVSCDAAQPRSRGEGCVGQSVGSVVASTERLWIEVEGMCEFVRQIDRP